MYKQVYKRDLVPSKQTVLDFSRTHAFLEVLDNFEHSSSNMEIPKTEMFGSINMEKMFKYAPNFRGDVSRLPALKNSLIVYHHNAQYSSALLQDNY